jgi:hypothetical protein
VGWYEAYAAICGERELAHVFCMRSMASGAFHCAFPHPIQQAFLKAHERAFFYFDGVFAVLRCDDLKSAVKKICEAISERKALGLWPSDHTGDFTRSSAPRQKVTRRVEQKEKADTAAFDRRAGIDIVLAFLYPRLYKKTKRAAQRVFGSSIFSVWLSRCSSP